MLSGDRGDTPKPTPQGRAPLARTGHPIHALVLPRRSIHAARWPQSEPPAPGRVQTAARVEPGASAARRRPREAWAERASRIACAWTMLGSHGGRGINTGRFLDDEPKVGISLNSAVRPRLWLSWRQSPLP